MPTHAPRPLEESAKVVESARCNQCDRVIVAITTAGPGVHRAQCGHAVGSHSLAELATSRGAEDDDVRRAVDGAEELLPDGGREETGDSRHIDPAGDVADLFERAEIDAEVLDGTSEAELREFIERAEAGEFGDADPGLNAAVRIVRALLDDDGEGGEA